MPTPIFSNSSERKAIMEPIRTTETMTCGIVNIPLTKPAFINFHALPEQKDEIIKFYNKESILYDFETTEGMDGIQRFHFRSKQELDAKMLRYTWQFFKHLRPKFVSQYRYLFWEQDDKTEDNFNKITEIYNALSIPYMFHGTSRGNHFLSVYPIPKDQWKEIIPQLRPTNETYPPTTLRLKANKYVMEMREYEQAVIVSRAFHSDTDRLRKWIVTQDFDHIARYYMVVWYPFNGVQLE